MVKNNSYRSKFSFGKRIESYVKALMLKEGLDVYTPEVDDDAVDIVVKAPSGQYMEVQVKAASKGAFFAAITHKKRKNYWFVFYSEELNKFWILSSDEFIKEASQNKKGKNIDKYSIHFLATKNGVAIPDQKKVKYEAINFQRIIK